MKKIIELVERYFELDQNPPCKDNSKESAEAREKWADTIWNIEQEIGDRIARRRELEATPITEDWLEEHGFVLESDGYVYYDDSKGAHDQYYVLVQLRHNKKKTRRIEIRTMWRSFYAEQGIFNASFLLDACELCGIKMEG